MDELLARLDPDIDLTIERLKAKKFSPDPIAGTHFSKIVSVMSSAYKRHGYIIEKAILERLKMNADFEVWSDPSFPVSAATDHVANGLMATPGAIIGNNLASGVADRTLQVDAIVFNKNTKVLSAYEIKRGSGLHDAGKRRSILRDVMCVQALLKSYGEARGYDVASAQSRIIFYYGKCSIKPPFALTADDLDDHFGYPVKDAVEAVNDKFRARLFEILTS